MNNQWYDEYKYYRITYEDGSLRDSSPLSINLHSITGFYASDYVKPVVTERGHIFQVVSDESCFKDHYCVCLIVFEHQHKKKCNR